MMRRIAIEEAFVTPEIVAEWKRVLASDKCEPGFRKMGESIYAENPGNALLQKHLLDLGSARIMHMDSVGIGMQVLSLASPGVQVFDAQLASRLASEANDALAIAVHSYPYRLAGLGAVAPQDPAAAAREIERIRSIGLKGLIINSHTFGEYLDLPKYRPILEAAQAAHLPIYLHPREPGPGHVAPYLDHGLYFAGWGFAAETGLHAMRLIMSGTLERFPRLKIILGHMGEAIPFWLQRIDNRYLVQVKIGAVEKLPRLPSEYFLENFVITTAGVPSMPALRLCLDVLGAGRILFAADYPFEDDAEAVRFLDNADISAEERELIAWRNATKLLQLDAAYAEL